MRHREGQIREIQDGSRVIFSSTITFPKLPRKLRVGKELRAASHPDHSPDRDSSRIYIPQQQLQGLGGRYFKRRGIPFWHHPFFLHFTVNSSSNSRNHTHVSLVVPSGSYAQRCFSKNSGRESLKSRNYRLKHHYFPKSVLEEPNWQLLPLGPVNGNSQALPALTPRE